jgi:hypothetical protein
MPRLLLGHVEPRVLNDGSLIPVPQADEQETGVTVWQACTEYVEWRKAKSENPALAWAEAFACWSAVRRERGEEVLGDRIWGGWAAGDPDVDRKVGFEGACEFASIAEDVASEGAVAERGDEPWFGHSVVGGEEWSCHAGGD